MPALTQTYLTAKTGDATPLPVPLSFSFNGTGYYNNLVLLDNTGTPISSTNGLPISAASLPLPAGAATDATLASILSVLQQQKFLTVWTDDTGAFFIMQVAPGGGIAWTTSTGGASAGPGVGMRVAGASAIVDATRCQATASGTGFANGDYLSHIVTTDPSSGAVIGHFWLNVSANAKLSADPANGTYVPISALPAGAATAALQNATIAALGTPLQAGGSVGLIAGSNFVGYTGSVAFGPKSALLTLNASSYAIGACIGGLQTLSIFRDTVNASAAINKIEFQWLSSTNAPPVNVFILAKPPAVAPADGVVPTLTLADLKYLIAQVTITPGAIAGLTQAIGSVFGEWFGNNQDTTVTTNAYVIVTAAIAIPSSPPANGQVALFGGY